MPYPLPGKKRPWHETENRRRLFHPEETLLTENPNMIYLRGLKKRFGEKVVLDGVDLDIREGRPMLFLDVQEPASRSCLSSSVD